MARRSTNKKWNLIKMKGIQNKKGSLRQKRRILQKAGEGTAKIMIKNRKTKDRISLMTNSIISEKFSFKIKSSHRQAKKRQSSRSRSKS